LKTRTARLAALAGHADFWTSTQVEAARLQANTTARPRRLHGATPDQVWAARVPLTAEGRESFQAAVHWYQAEGWNERGGQPAEPSHWDESAVDRVALRRALVAHDLLWLTRRSIPALIERPKAAIKG